MMMRKLVHNLWCNNVGGTMTMTAILMPLIMGFAGLGLDMTNWYMQRRNLQNLADSASVMGAYSVNASRTTEDVAALIITHLQGQGYDASIDTVTVNSPPSAGLAVGRSNYVEVTVTRAVPMRFVSTFWDMDVSVQVRSVAGIVVIGEQCVVALDESIDRALNFSGTANVDAGCGVASNSSSEEAIYIGGSATLHAEPAQAFGDILISGSGTLISDSPIQSYSQRVPDPYGPDGSNIQVPAGSSCDYSGTTSAGNNDTFSPGRYCGDILVQGTNVTFDPGVYIIDGGDFISNANSSMSGEGVTFILTGNSPSDVGAITMNGNTTADFSAPTDPADPYQGILFFQDPMATEMATNNKFNGGSNLTLNGVVYFPNSEITFNGGASFSPSCLQIIGKKLNFSGSSVINNDEALCESMDMSTISQERVQLIE